MNLFGLSLSFCVGDILRNKYRAEDVTNIITCTRFNDILDAYTYYKDSYWYDYSENEVLAVLMAIWPKVVQPRLTNPRYSHNISQGHWIHMKDLQEAHDYCGLTHDYTALTGRLSTVKHGRTLVRAADL
jgi:hypothetical protein